MARNKNSKRSDGRLQSKVYLGVVDGKAKYKYVYAATQKELNAKIDEVKLQLGKGLDVSAQRDTFGEWAQRWLKLKKTEVSDKRYRSYCAVIKYMEHLNNVSISKIRMQDIQDVIIDNLHLSDYMLRQIKSVCSQALQLAIDNRVIDYNPANAVKIPKRDKEGIERRALTQKEQQWIIDTPHRAQTAAMIMMFAGLRRGELIPLLWSDIDFNAKTISVSKSVESIDGKFSIKRGAKSEAGNRVVYIPEKLVNYLKTVDRNNNMLVCPSAHGKMHTSDSWKSMWESYLNELNFKYGDFDKIIDFNKPKSRFAPVKIPFVIPRFTAHWLRHTYITMLYLAGVDVLTAKEQAGHSDIKVTMEIYTHLDKQHKQHQISKLDDYLNNGCQMGVTQKAK